MKKYTHPINIKKHTKNVEEYSRNHYNSLMNNTCINCKQPVNHVKINCDYCYLRDKIKKLETRIYRLEKIFFEKDDSLV